MTIGITCADCDSEVVFLFGDETKNPTEVCDCGSIYQLKVTKIGEEK